MTDHAIARIVVRPDGGASSGSVQMWHRREPRAEGHLVGLVVGSYLRARDAAAPTSPGAADEIHKALTTLSRLPANERTRACREIFLAALEAYSAEALDPVDDVVGGWLATAEVWAQPEVAYGLASALGLTLEVGSSWNTASTRRQQLIDSRMQAAESTSTASVSLHT